jgi:hypothetical protein
MVELSKNKNGVVVVTVATNSSLSSFSHSATGQSSVDLSSPSVATPSCFSSSCSSSGVQKSDEKKPAAKVGRRTSKEVQRANSRIAQLTKKDKEAMKQATVLIHRSQGLPRNHPGKKSAAIIVQETNYRLQSNISEKSAARYVRQGLIGVSPLKRGPVGHFPPGHYNALKGVFVTYLKLEQAATNKQSTLKDLSKLVNACVNKAGFNKVSDDLTKKLKKDTAEMFSVGKANIMEQRRLMWTTSYNLDVWFNTWKDLLIDLGFGKLATPDDRVEGKIKFYPGVMDRIINVDETDGSLDDTTGQRGGRPPMTFFALEVPGGGTAVNKSGYLATLICGSTASGNPLPVHFQLKILAQTVEGMRMSIDWFHATKKVTGTFGFPSRRSFPCTFGMNEKAGMNAVELEKYMKNAILPLYPDIQDVPGKQVLLKVDSGPGRLNVEMLADLRLHGLYLVPGVPNTTHHTQETDQNYGIFKSSFRENLCKISQCWFENSLTLKVCNLLLLVFGGECPSTGLVLRDSFSDAFSIERNLSCWKKCGAVPLTKASLRSGAIMHELPIGNAAIAVAGQ